MKNRNTPWLLLAGLTVGMAAHAGEPATTAPPDDIAYSVGMKAAIDPATGKLRQPTAAEMRALQTKATLPASRTSAVRYAMPRNEAEALKTQRRLPQGGYKIKVPEDRMSALTATVQADGSVRLRHGDADGHLPVQQEAEHE